MVPYPFTMHILFGMLGGLLDVGVGLLSTRRQ